MVEEGFTGFQNFLVFDFPPHASVNLKEVLKVVPVLIEGIYRLLEGVFLPVEISVVSQARDEVCTGQFLSPI